MRFLISSVLLGLLSLSPATGRAQVKDEDIEVALLKALPLLERASAGSADQRECFTCHSQALPILALSEARKHGFPVDAANFQRQLEHTFAHLDRNRERFLSGKGTGGKADTAGYALWALNAGGWPSDETTSAVTQYLIKWQADSRHWTCASNRPPSEASDFATTFLALRGLKAYGSPEQQEGIAKRVKAARGWLIRSTAEDNEDRVFRLRGLAQVDVDSDVIAEAVDALVSRQQEDGGWSQLDGGDSDAYATATALGALHAVGNVERTDPVYLHGIRYLLSSQQEDGSWHVISRSEPFQSYYETGFPHGTDQFISTSATAWAVLALLATQDSYEGK